MRMEDPMNRPLSPLERERLKPALTAYGIDPNNYTSDAALCAAITQAVLAQVAAEANPEAGFYEI